MSYVVKLQTPYEFVKNQNISAEMSLRRAIILQAIIDASNNSSHPKLQKFEQEAKSWIFKENSDFINICAEGGVCPRLIRKKTMEIINKQKSIKQLSFKEKVERGKMVIRNKLKII